MSEHNLSAPGWPAPAPSTGDVPERYFGVWSRTLLETPDTRDTTTLVRWMQLGQWHADLRVPQSIDGPLQGFSGTTRVTQVGDKEMCTWQRLVDYQPPRATVDEGWMEFETPERVLERGIHGVYFEIWDRLPGSTGRRIALSEPAREDGRASARIFVSGNYLMRVRPCEPIGPAFEISFGSWDGEVFRIEASTVGALQGTVEALELRQVDGGRALVTAGGRAEEWGVMEWWAGD